VIDDIGAVIIIALAYTAGVNVIALIAAGLIFLLMIGMNRAGEIRPGPYVALAIALWVAVLLSGVHATVAGVLAALTVPLVRSPGAPDAAGSLLHRFEHAIQPWVAFLIVPVFGFANAGVSLAGLGWADLFAPLPLGIAAALFFGKQIGIFGSVRLAVALGLARRPRGTTWLHIYGVAMLCGIGFTMSLFIGGLAFDDPAYAAAVKIGVLAGSLLSASFGYLLFVLAPALAPKAASSGRAHASA
jgi:NhaA family Na+:H+ antiporter